MPALTAALTAALLTAGLILAPAGLAGFHAVWCSPDRDADLDSLLLARRIATAGRWSCALGLLLHVAAGGSAGTLAQVFLLAAACAALASVATKADPQTRRAQPLPG